LKKVCRKYVHPSPYRLASPTMGNARTGVNAWLAFFALQCALLGIFYIEPTSYAPFSPCPGGMPFTKALASLQTVTHVRPDAPRRDFHFGVALCPSVAPSRSSPGPTSRILVQSTDFHHISAA
jgi:hypothetical protein